MKKHAREKLFLFLGLLLMVMGIVVLVSSFYSLVVLSISPDRNKVVAGYVIPVFLIVIGYAVLRGKDIGFPSFKPI